MKILLYNFVIFFGLINLVDSDTELHILNSNISSGSCVLIEFKNNSRYNYCFVVDTNYYSRDFYPNRINFRNPKIFLYDISGNMTGMNVEIKDHISINDSIIRDHNKINSLSRKGDTLLVNEFKLYSDLNKNGFVNTLMIYTVKPKQSLKLKVPFNLVTKYIKDGVHEYYEVDSSKKYKARIEYMIKREYIEKYIPKEKINSLEKKGCKFFTGKLVSNKVPLILK
ncbi:hypothetical protein [Flavobacterium algicola]|uniref:hypothetical protein n=1 Tax=Flavobacterium algicola TaxID=556529 RepID=UPI001EFC941C|nr:hypothetical protein [Flavobacterium algicola]MCG9791983.1 hypothetical protein [Flavobacterium algicola]